LPGVFYGYNRRGLSHLYMALDIQQREREGIVILDVSGRLTVGENVSGVREKIQALSDSGSHNIILNLAEVDYIDSTGLGGLVISFTTLKKAGGSLKLLNASRRNIELLILTKLTTVFEIFDDEQDAVNSFFPNRQIKKFDILDFVQQQGGSDK
jgi:anti-sigma B factor antagonist